MKRYKETKEKLRRRKEEAKRMRQMRFTDADKLEASDSTKDADTSLLTEDDLVSQKLVEKNCIVDELDIISKKKASPYEEWKKIEQKLKKKASGKMWVNVSLQNFELNKIEVRLYNYMYTMFRKNVMKSTTFKILEESISASLGST